jgi:hypothetical protein
MNTNKQQATETRIVPLTPGMYIVRFCSTPALGEGAILSIAPSAANTQVEFFASEGIQNNTLLHQNDCVVVRCCGGEGNILITSISRTGVSMVGARIDRIAGAVDRPGAEIPNLSTHAPPRLAPAAPRELVNLLGHVEMTGDVKVPTGQWLGDPQSNYRLEGFTIEWPDRPNDVDIAYSCVIGGVGRSPAVLSGGYCGTRQRAAPITAITASLVGKNANAYKLKLEAVFSGAPTQAVSSGVECRGLTGREHLIAIRVNLLRNG